MGPSKTSKTPRAAPAKTVRTPVSKKKSAQNASILSFFKKAPAPDDESMFVGNAGHIVNDVDRQEPEDVELIEGRYNETQEPVKRRRLGGLEEDAGDWPPLAVNGYASGKTTPPPVQPPPPRKKRKGPFLDDSDTEDEETCLPKAANPLPEAPGPKNEEEEEEEDRSLPPESKPQPSLFDAIFESAAIESDREQKLDGDYAGFADLDYPDDEDFEGEEDRERKFMEAQARLEAEEAGNYSRDDGVDASIDDGSMEECCPICNSSLAGISADQATVHVNACLDGDPTPLTKPSPKKDAAPAQHDQVEGHEVSRRFARAAQPRPGQASPFSLGQSSTSSSAFTKLMSGRAEDAAWATAAAAEHASRGKLAYQRTCPFYKIMPGFFICVDAFRYGAVEGCRAYFLSHFHSDHYIGLTSNWSHGPIYCSRVTGSLVKNQLRTASKWVVELDFEETVEVPGTEGVSVTMIPANHCPGSSLFLFEKVVGNKGARAKGAKGPRAQRILHCGDFRACPAHVEHPLLKPDTLDSLTGKTKQQKIDVCYLDTTYLNPRYSFPRQDDVISACADLCTALSKGLADGDGTKWQDVLHRREGGGRGDNESVSKFFAPAPAEASKLSLESSATAQNALSVLGKPPPTRNRLLVICGTYSIGKERVCKAIAQALRTKIFAPPGKIRIVAQLGDPELTALMTSDAAEAQVHMQMLMEIRAETLAEYLDSYRPHFSRIVGFRPSGWNYRPTLANGGGKSAAAAVNANLPPSSVPTTSILHGPGWRTRFGAQDLVPQRGSTREAMCFGVPYSEHSSFRELALFIMALRIEKVVPTVNVGSDQSRRRMKGWLDRWMAERRRGGLARLLEAADADDDGSKAEEKKTKKDGGRGSGGGKDGTVLWEGKDGRGGGVYW